MLKKSSYGNVKAKAKSQSDFGDQAEMEILRAEVLKMRSEQAKLIDDLLLISEKTQSKPVIAVGKRKYYIHSNPITSVVNEAEVPYYIIRRIKKIDK